jgi:light-regulated signal transduction histidine kinase (bacteriophytochrome)
MIKEDEIGNRQRELETGSNKRLSDRLSEVEDSYRAILNILEDVNTERNKLADIRKALQNILEDVETERANTNKARALLEETNKELESFSYSVSHDLRAPLRAISGFSEAVIEDYAPLIGEEGKRYLSLIADNANRMGQLIDDLLNFSRLGRQQINKVKVDIAELAHIVADELVSQAGSRRIRFTVQNVPPVFGDRAMIQQVLVNLFSNAIKFTKDREEASIEFGCTTTDGKNVYFARDNGAGFDMRYVGQLFGVFQRLHSITEYEGTGVGLALVQRIIIRHGGRVWAEGEIDKGAAFYFTLPDAGS